MSEYNSRTIEQKWAKVWEKKKTWKVDLGKAKKPYYNLMMFPYPSSEGLHVGNVYAFTGSDIHGRFERMRGNDVFEPMGFDSFGIHSENFAIKMGTHPKAQTAKNIKHFTEQLTQLGALFDWSRAVTTSEPEYYKWTQWLFLQLFKAGLAYKAKAPVDWCPSCKTVLADEQVIDGKCERCDSQVVQKELEQWFFRITKYADRLLKNLETIDWSERTKIAQKNWIGKSEGAVLQFPISVPSGHLPQGDKLLIEVFTTRPDTLFGATYMVLAPEHELVEKLKPQIKNWAEVEYYRKEASRKSELERTELAKEKTGVELKGIKAVNPATKKEIPVFIADYVLATYGTGAIMAVPAHDERDMEFAQKFKLSVSEAPLVSFEEGVRRGCGKKKTNYHLRDWLISRQRYWGPPIPIVYCKKCGTVPVPEKDLPVKLPEVKDFRPTGTGKSPLASVSSFVNTKCPKCKGKAERETDVSDTFLDSAWYFFRYPCTEFKNKPVDKLRVKKWLPVNMYIGGQEHAVLHLLYTRFITMALKDLGFIEFEEPFRKFRAHGLITKEGAKMSKSKGNVVNPDEYFKRYGADTVRMYLMFLGPFSEGGDWSDKGIVGISRFLNRVYDYVEQIRNPKSEIRNKSQIQNSNLETLKHQTIKKVTVDLENLRYNTAIAALMEYFNELSKVKSQKSYVETLLILLAPFAPYITEELWQKLGNRDSVHSQPWPSFDKKSIQTERIRLIIQVNGKVRDVMEVPADTNEKQATELALKSRNIQKWIGSNKVKRTVFVPGRLVNVVV